MPKSQATTPHTMIATIATRARGALGGLPPKSTMLKMVCATAELIAVMSTRPTKLQMAAMMIEAPGPIARVETAGAIALGASVAPFTTVAPSVSTKMVKSTGSDPSIMRNEPKSSNGSRPFVLFHCLIFYRTSLKVKAPR